MMNRTYKIADGRTCVDCKLLNQCDDGDGRTDTWCEHMLEHRLDGGEGIDIYEEGCNHFDTGYSDMSNPAYAKFSKARWVTDGKFCLKGLSDE